MFEGGEMKNLAGNEGCDEIIRKELEAAGIEIVDIFSSVVQNAT